MHIKYHHMLNPYSTSDRLIAMRVSLLIATFLLPFLVSITIFAAQIDSPSSSLYLQSPLNNDHDVDQHKHASTRGFWSQKVTTMEKELEGDEKMSEKMGMINRRGRMTLGIAGSRLPDCMHACGSCSPCRLVTVSLACALHTEEAESCPVSYRCMCNGKSYPVP